MKPLFRQGGLTGDWFVLTRYSERDGIVVASIKYDVTDQMEHHLRQAREAALAEAAAAVRAAVQLPATPGRLAFIRTQRALDAIEALRKP